MSFVALRMYSCLLLLYVSYISVNHSLVVSNYFQSYYSSNKSVFILYNCGFVFSLFDCTRSERYTMSWKLQLRLLTNTNRSKASTIYYKNSSAKFRPVMQLMHDVKLNPGPEAQLAICCLYTIARSVVNKIDVDIITATETWLNPTILSS